MDDLVARTRAWIEGDPDPETRDELTRLLAVGDHEFQKRCLGRMRWVGAEPVGWAQGPRL